MTRHAVVPWWSHFNPDRIPCPACEGEGKVTRSAGGPPWAEDTYRVPCAECYGDGTVQACPRCGERLEDAERLACESCEWEEVAR